MSRAVGLSTDVLMFNIDFTSNTDKTSYYKGYCIASDEFFYVWPLTLVFGFIHYTFFLQKKIVQLHKYKTLPPWKWLKHSLESYTTLWCLQQQKKCFWKLWVATVAAMVTNTSGWTHTSLHSKVKGSKRIQQKCNQPITHCKMIQRKRKEKKCDIKIKISHNQLKKTERLKDSTERSPSHTHTLWRD